MEKYRNFSLLIILIPTPDFPHFYSMLGGNLGSLLYGDVSVMLTIVPEGSGGVSKATTLLKLTFKAKYCQRETTVATEFSTKSLYH